MRGDIVIVCGLSGSGKTHTAKKVEEELGNYEHLGAGVLRERLKIKNFSRKDTPFLLHKTIEMAEENRKKGVGTIVDGNLRSSDFRQCFYDLASHLGIGAIVVHCICSDEKEARKRMIARSGSLMAENPKDYKIRMDQARMWQNPRDIDVEIEGNEHLALIEFDTHTGRIEIVKIGNKADRDFVSKILSVLVKIAK
ncbi:MAG: ATP-binding protein [Nanoarchaeota archaeon]